MGFGDGSKAGRFNFHEFIDTEEMFYLFDRLRSGERYHVDNQWIGITALDAFTTVKNQSYLNLGEDCKVCLK